MNSEPIETPETADQTVLAQDPVQEAIADAVPQVDNSANEDAVLDRLLGIDEPAPRRDVPSPEPAAPPDPEFDRAVKALQRDGVPADVIAAAKSDPSKLKEWGLKAAKRQADVDKFGAEVASKKNKDEQARKEAPPQDREEPKSSASSGDDEGDADPLSQFSRIFGDEATKPIKTITDRLRSEFEERTRLLEVRHETQLAYERMSREYGRDVPSLDEISEVAARIGRENPGEFGSISEIVTEAFRQRLGEPKRADPRNAAKPSVGKAPPRPVRQVDKEDTVLDVLLSGGSRADALRAMSR